MTLQFIINHPLNRHRKIQAIAGFIRWQIASRIVPGKIVFEWINGAKVVVGRGESGFTGNIYSGLHDFADMAYVLHTLTPQDLFIDVGANIGSYTILACAVRGARGYCFEPVPSTYIRLVDNLNINGLGSRVKMLNIGIADKDGELRFTSGEDSTNHILAREEMVTDTISVKVFTLDSILADEVPTVMKIDVEGFELPVLNGGHKVFSNKTLHSVIMELNGSGERYGFDENSILQKMSMFGFNTYSYNPFNRSLMPLKGKSSTSGNTLFIRDETKVKERLSKTPKVSINNRLL